MNVLFGMKVLARQSTAATDFERVDTEPISPMDTIPSKASSLARTPLYQRLLGDAWAQLPAPMRELHDLRGELVAEGRASVERGTGLLARVVARLFGFPQAGQDVPVTVSFRARAGREHWQRTFAGRSFASVQDEGRGRFEGLLCEGFGPLKFGMALVLDEGRMRLVVRRWNLLGIPMPRALAPGGNSYEFAEDGRFRFHVEIGHPFTGPIVTHRGWLVPRR
jgi:hypothetical protein